MAKHKRKDDWIEQWQEIIDKTKNGSVKIIKWFTR